MRRPLHTTLRRARRAQAGFTAVAVLILLAVIASLGTTYLRHSMLDPRSAHALRDAHDAREATQSGLQFARQALATDSGITSGTVDNGASSASVSLTVLSDPRRAAVQVSALDDYGLGATLLTEVERVPVAAGAHPDDLPKLSPAKIAELLNDPDIPKHYLGGSQTIRDTDYEGLVIIRNSAGIFLDNVTVHGCIVSEDALLEDPFGDFGEQTPCLLIDGNLRIEPGDFLPGVAVVMPDGVIRTWNGDESVVIRGDVVANTVLLEGPGSVDGNIAAASTTLGSQLCLPGAGRGPQAWSAGLEMGSTWNTSFVAILPRFTTLAECQAILDYSFPSTCPGD